MKNVRTEANHIVNDISKMSQEEATRIYGIEFNPDGTVFDPIYNRTFISVAEWAEFNVEQDEVEYCEHIGGGRHEFDDFY